MQDLTVILLCGVTIPVVLLGESFLTIFINRKDSKLRERPSTVFINSLATSGGLIGVALVLFTLWRTVIFPDVKTCCFQKQYPLYWTLSYLHIVSVFCLVCLSLDRYLAICYPLRYHDLMRISHCRLLAASCWFVSAFLLVIPALSFFLYQDQNYTGTQGVSGLAIKALAPLSVETFSEDCSENFTSAERNRQDIWRNTRRVFSLTYVAVYLLMCLAIACMYALVVREFCRGDRNLSTTSTMKEEDIRIRKKTTRDLFLIVLMYLTLSMPHVILKASKVDWKTNAMKFRITVLLVIIHQILFLPIYVWRFAEFRGALRSLRICTFSARLRSMVSPFTPRMKHEHLKTTPSASSTTTMGSSIVSEI